VIGALTFGNALDDGDSGGPPENTAATAAAGVDIEELRQGAVGHEVVDEVALAARPGAAEPPERHHVVVAELGEQPQPPDELGLLLPAARLAQPLHGHRRAVAQRAPVRGREAGLLVPPAQQVQLGEVARRGLHLLRAQLRHPQQERRRPGGPVAGERVPGGRVLEAGQRRRLARRRHFRRVGGGERLRGGPHDSMAPPPAPRERKQARRRGGQQRHGDDDRGCDRPGRRRAARSAAAAAAGVVGGDLRRDAGAERLGPVRVDEVRRGARPERGESLAAQVAVVPVLEAGLQLRRQVLGNELAIRNKSSRACILVYQELIDAGI
jgi:hypothetical protein